MEKMMRSKFGVVALASALLAGGMVSAAVPITGVRDVTVSAPSSHQTSTQQAPAPATNETDKERFDRLRGLAPRRRLLWDGKNRSAGDRAHKRLKQRRRCGRA